MAEILDLENAECKFCGGGFGGGQTVKAVWAGPVEEGEYGEPVFIGQSLDVYHATCMKAEDARPREVRVFRTPSTGKAHIMRPRPGASESLCNNLKAERGEMETVRTDFPREDIDGLCDTCARLSGDLR